MLTTMVHDHADRLRSYELVAEVMELEPRKARGAGRPLGEPAPRT